ncbi:MULTISPECIES: methyltransferase domain-containing protein [unclassified Streptomyces]|uniref:methyltransferase domain-containing protein n=1 Tax=unclassified Streptomyces TaxID=2593676 RepID=UPI000F717B7D|nr:MULTISPECIES: methyltransferase domain-containing protein [unclassified Streptomyces]AZM59810.1 SAM-dependent methyltransferase [Streptomyces sp. WAC 01438]RSM93869.1 SAM-dependent methyltransferase [Streptomyces sp. WAC 01420]
MTPTLVRQHPPHTGAAPRVDLRARARDWSEIQERMLVPLYEAVYQRLDVGPATRLLGLGCGSGLALLMAASRGATITGVDTCADRLALARERLLPEEREPRADTGTRIVRGSPADTARADAEAYTMVTAFEPIGCLTGDTEGLGELLAEALPLTGHGAAVVLAGWGPPERCATASVLRVAAKLAEPLPGGTWRPADRDDLERVAQRAGLRPDGSGRVACPFGYADTDSALRGLKSTGLFDPAISATDQVQVDKELTEAVHPYQRPDGTVWMPNVFRYLVARTP